ncbi:MAG: hypothetical protein ACLFWM_09430 [Actinomycetota bacterium]
MPGIPPPPGAPRHTGHPAPNIRREWDGYVVSVAHDPGEVDLDTEVVNTLIGSLALPACTTDRVLVGREVLLGEDLNGDGEVATAEELMSR